MLHLMLAGWLGLGWPFFGPFTDHKAARAPLPAYVPVGKVRQTTYAEDGWTMTIRRDGFSGMVRCRLVSLKTLAQGRITYAGETLGFQLGDEDNALDAWYRVDGGPPRRWRDLYPQLAAQGVPLDQGPLDNPTGGLVLIPRDEVADAKVVMIKVGDHGPVRTFHLRGFARALAAAKYNGCADEGSFERDPWH